VASRPWYLSNPALLAHVADEAVSHHPGLWFEEGNDVVIVRGVFEIREDDSVLDTYELELELPRESDRGIPLVRETGGRIPRHEDRHVNPNDGTLCVVLPEAYWYAHPTGLSFVEFLDGPLRSYLASQSLVERGRPWPAGEWSHGAAGILEFYAEAFGTKDLKSILGLVGLLARDQVKGHWDCGCGSGKRLRQCHGPKVIELRARLPRELAARLIDNSTSGQAIGR
jgi:hypothetical protein